MRARALWVVCWALLGGSAVFGQTAITEQSIAAKLQAPFLILRGMYAGGKVDFDAQGNPTGRTDTLPLSLSAIVIQSIHLDDQRLEIKGKRTGLLFAPGFPVDGPETASLTSIGGVTIRVARDPQHPEELLSALTRVFSVGFDEALANEAPVYWRAWMQHQLHPEAPAFCPAKGATEANFRGPGSPVARPRLIHYADPAFSEEARRNAVNGMVIVGLTVDTSGQPQDVCIVRALGMGLDEMAVRAVDHYRFAPATMNGKPVPVAIKIEVNFRIRQ